MDSVEITAKLQTVFSPQPLEDPYKFLGPAIAFLMIQPRLPEPHELILKKPGCNIQTPSAARHVIYAGAHLGDNSRMPKSRM